MMAWRARCGKDSMNLLQVAIKAGDIQTIEELVDEFGAVRAELEALDCAVVTADTLIECTTPPGGGIALPLTLSISGQPSVLTRTSAPPSILHSVGVKYAPAVTVSKRLFVQPIGTRKMETTKL